MNWIIFVVLAITAQTAPGSSDSTLAANSPRTGSSPLLAVQDEYRETAGGGERPVLGVPTSLAENPWQVALVAAAIPDNFAAQFCGGSTISDYWVLTAAHCVDGGTTPEMIQILRGTDDLTTGGERWTVEEIVIPEAWNPENNDADIALLRLTRPVPQGEQVGLWSASIGALDAGTLLRVTGWGRTGETSPRSKKLIRVEVPLQPLDMCNAVDAYDGAVTPNMICAGAVEGGADACKGDSGGPATAGSGTKRYQIGIVSWAIGCGRPKRYGVYTAVEKFEPWIRQRLATPSGRASPRPNSPSRRN